MGNRWTPYQPLISKQVADDDSFVSLRNAMEMTRLGCLTCSRVVLKSSLERCKQHIVEYSLVDVVPSP